MIDLSKRVRIGPVTSVSFSRTVVVIHQDQFQIRTKIPDQVFEVFELFLGRFDDVKIVSTPQTVPLSGPLHLPDSLGVGGRDAIVSKKTLLHSQAKPELDRNSHLFVPWPDDVFQKLKSADTAEKRRSTVREPVEDLSFDIYAVANMFKKISDYTKRSSSNALRVKPVRITYAIWASARRSRETFSNCRSARIVLPDHCTQSFRTTPLSSYKIFSGCCKPDACCQCSCRVS